MSAQAVARLAGLARLQRYAEPRSQPAASCEMCSQNIKSEHGHVVDLRARRLMCVCRGCFLLFTPTMGRVRAVPREYSHLAAPAVAADAWRALQLPIGLAFVLRDSTTDRLCAFYPSPAGATESELPLDDWDALVRSMPGLEHLLPDVQALLVWRRDGDTPSIDAFIVPIDACYELTGRIRRHWQGFQGGPDVWREVEAFFQDAHARASEGTHA